MSHTNVWEAVPIKTPHYTFELEYKGRIHPKQVYTHGHLFVGDENNPCLSISFYLPDILQIDDRYDIDTIRIAKLNKLKNIRECIIDQENTPNKESFSVEMLDAVIKEIKRSFPYIYHLRLMDKSEIPCDFNDTLDLMIYNIALYKKTWYEENFNAYIADRDEYNRYRYSLEKYASKETKDSIDWSSFYVKHMGLMNPYAYRVVSSNAESYKSMYTSSKTFPEFFIKMSNSVPAKDKCKLFKDWLSEFINGTMNIMPTREWYIDLYTVKKTVSRRSKTRKQRKSRKQN